MDDVFIPKTYNNMPVVVMVQPIGLRRKTAAAFLGVSVQKFDAMAREGRIPKPRMLDSIKLWDRVELEEFYYSLSLEDEADYNDWDVD